MSYRDVFRRDLKSVYRSRTGTAVAAILALSTIVAVGLLSIATNTVIAALVGALLMAVVLLTLVFVGSPRSVAIAVIVFTVLAVGLALLISDPRPDVTRRPAMYFAVMSVGSALSLLLPLVALIGSYAALVGERETGSVRFLLGLPNSRTDAYLGKYLSRAAVVIVPLVVGLILTAGVVSLTFENGSFLGMLGFMLVSVLYTLLFVGIGLSASAYANSSHRAVAMVIAVFVTFRFGWTAFRWIARDIMTEPRDFAPEWFFWIGRINPINAYVKLTTLFAEFEYGHPLIVSPRTGQFMPPPSPVADSFVISYEFAALVLIVWAIIAPIAGLLYFQDRDLI